MRRVRGDVRGGRFGAVRRSILSSASIPWSSAQCVERSFQGFLAGLETPKRRLLSVSQSQSRIFLRALHQRNTHTDRNFLTPRPLFQIPHAETRTIVVVAGGMHGSM